MDECANNQYATARCRPEAEADNRVVAEGEDGYFSGDHGFTRGAPYVYHSLLTASIENRPYRGCYLAQKGIVGSKGERGNEEGHRVRLSFESAAIGGG